METGLNTINLNDSVKTALNIAQSIAREYANEVYTPSHLLKALLHREVGLRDFILSLGKDISYLEEWADIRIEECVKSTFLTTITPAPAVYAVMEEADYIRIKLGLFDINPICVLAGLIKPGVGFSSDQLKIPLYINIV